MYNQGECLKQPVGSTSTGLIVRHTNTVFRDCQFDNRVWVGNAAYSGRSEDSNKRHEDCSMYEGSIPRS